MNILDQAQFHSCTSCQVCGSVCPVMAISFDYNGDGFLRPIIDSSLCINCGFCRKICVKFDDNIKYTNNEQLSRYDLFSAYAISDTIRASTTSGGLADILSHRLMAEGYKVIGVVYDNVGNNARHIIANTNDDLLRFRGSKYIQPHSMNAFQCLISGCRHQKYAVFGLPCQVYALARYLDSINKRDQCILIDLYCHGCPSKLVWDKVSDDIRRKTKVNQFDNVLWRSKMRGWGHFIIEVYKNGKRIYHSTPADNAFYELYFSNQLLNEGCNSCQIRGTLEYTDIRLGDFWGPLFRRNTKGISGVSIMTERGKNVFERIMNQISFSRMPYSSFLPYQSWQHEYKINIQLRQHLLSCLKDEHTTSRKIVSLLPSHKSLKYIIKRLLKQFFSLIPR